MAFSLLILILFILVSVIVVAIFARLEKSREAFDERQLLLQSKARKLTIFVESIVLGAGALGTDYGLLGRFSPAFIMFTALAAGVTVFIVYCVWHDVYISYRENHNKAFISTFLLFLLFIAASALELMKGNWQEHGQITLSSGMPFLWTFSLGAILLTAALRRLRDRRSGAEDGEDE